MPIHPQKYAQNNKGCLKFTFETALIDLIPTRRAVACCRRFFFAFAAGILYSFRGIISVFCGEYADISAKAFCKIRAVGKAAPSAHLGYA